jgi:hypothetical protein
MWSEGQGFMIYQVSTHGAGGEGFAEKLSGSAADLI